MPEVQRFVPGRPDLPAGAGPSSPPALFGSPVATGEFDATGHRDAVTIEGASGPLGLSRQDLDELVDTVVDRIERRVVEELQRRGRYLTPGAF